jgi:hypothetical protein
MRRKEITMMIINTRADLDTLSAADQAVFKARLAASIYNWQWIDGQWVLQESTTTLEQFGFTVADFPDTPKPEKPDYNPDERAAQRKVDERIAELKQLLLDSDYKVLPDYDKPSEDIKAQRQAWRDEIRELQGAAE